METNTPPSASSFPFVSDDYHLIVSEEEFDQYTAISRRRKWIIGSAVATIVLVVLSISLAVIPMFLKAHLDVSADISHTEHSSAQDIPEELKKTPIFVPTVEMKAVYGE